MEPGTLGDRQKIECRAQSDMKGGKTERPCHQLLFFQNDTLTWQLVRTGCCGGTCRGFSILQGGECGLQSRPSEGQAHAVHVLGTQASVLQASLATHRSTFLTCIVGIPHSTFS